MKALAAGQLPLLIGPAPRCHAGLQGCSRPVLSLRVRTVKPAIAVVRRPVIFIVAIRVVHGVLGLISPWIDKCKGLARHDPFPA